jgi:hypothetical protein
MSENVAIVKSSWAGWRQGLEAQMVRDLEEGLPERIREWDEANGSPALQPEEFIDNGDEILVRARADESGEQYTFRYTMDGRRIAGWEVV